MMRWARPRLRRARGNRAVVQPRRGPWGNRKYRPYESAVHRCRNAFIREDDRIFRTYFADGRGDENLGTTWSCLDITALGRQEEWEDSPEGYPQTRRTSGGTTTTRTGTRDRSARKPPLEEMRRCLGAAPALCWRVRLVTLYR
jgi:hypothetical protein